MDASGRVSLPRSKTKTNIYIKTDGDIKEDKKMYFQKYKRVYQTDSKKIQELPLKEFSKLKQIKQK